MDMNSQVILNEPSLIKIDFTFLRLNDIESDEKWLQLFDGIKYVFYDIQKVLRKT